jgi:queuine/archaeosine tRNA-ribosyltransferase
VLSNITESQAARNSSRFELSGTTNEMTPLKPRHVVSLLEQRGLTAEMARSFNKSFDGAIYARWGREGEVFTSTKN